MDLATLEARQASNVRPVIASTMTLLGGYRERPVSDSLWHQLLVLLFSVVQPASVRSARFARAFYDSERARAGLPEMKVPLAELSFRRFVWDMEPVREAFRRPITTDHEIKTAALRAARSVENSGRWTIMKAAEQPDPALEAAAKAEEALADSPGVSGDDDVSDSDDSVEEKKPAKKKPEKVSSLVRGWARVATGKETCGWCWMLVSRGPVYSSARSAGSRLDDRDAMQTAGAGLFDPKEHMNQWHEGCDCKVVPVFRLDDWEGRDRYLAAQELWHKATKGFRGQDAVNAYRRAVEDGQLHELLHEMAA